MKFKTSRFIIAPDTFRYLKRSLLVKAIILAAGEGSRLHPLTLTRPKHMICLAGKPLLEHSLSAIKKSGIDEVLLIVRHHSEMIKNHFGEGEKFGVSISYIEQRKLLGTADAIGLGKGYVDDEDFLVVYGDLLIDPKVVIKTLREHNKKGSMALVAVPVDNPSQFGIVQPDNGFVKGIVEKPKSEAFGNLANGGIYVLSSEVFEEIKRTPRSPRGEVEITETLNLLLKRGLQVSCVEVEPDGWLDVGRPWDLLNANRRILDEVSLENRGNAEQGAHLKGRVGVGDGATIASGAYIEGPVYIGEGSKIGPNCYIRPYTSLGRGVHIGNACEVKNSIIMKKTKMGHQTYVADSLVGARCNFGAGTITANLRFDEKKVRVEVRGSMVDSGLRKLGVIMGDDVKTGVGVRLMPGVKVGIEAWIGPSVTVYEKVPSRAIVMERRSLKLGRKL